HRADIRPHGRIEPVQTNRFVRADSDPTKAEGIHPQAAIVSVHGHRMGGDPFAELAVVGVPTAAAFQQPLEQVTRAAMPLSIVLVTGSQLVRDSAKQLRADDRRYRDHNMIARCTFTARLGVAWLFRLATYRPKPRTAFDHTGPTIGRVPNVYGVLEQ